MYSKPIVESTVFFVEEEFEVLALSPDGARALLRSANQQEGWVSLLLKR